MGGDWIATRGDWSHLNGEWVLTKFVRGSNGGHVERAIYHLSPHGPPFRYRSWHRENKNWERFTLDHCNTIEEAKACLAIMLRLT